jgi:5-methylcytosine-specific restriction endonuclease McrA
MDETYEVDHRVALFNGGSNDESNLVALCPHCHRKKTVDERIATATV